MKRCTECGTPVKMVLGKDSTGVTRYYAPLYSPEDVKALVEAGRGIHGMALRAGSNCRGYMPPGGLDEVLSAWTEAMKPFKEEK